MRADLTHKALNAVENRESGEVFCSEFIAFLNENGIIFERAELPSGDCLGKNCISINGISNRIFLFKESRAAVVPVFLSDFNNVNTAEPLLDLCRRVVVYAKSQSCDDIFYLYEDRWFYNKKFMQEHVLARLGRFSSVFARKCKVITNTSVKQSSALSAMIARFLEESHSYGSAKCKYRYALEYNGRIVAVATFSHPRRIPREIDDKTVIFNSYEWVRYASAPNCRVIGGMGRLLKAFIAEAASAKQEFPIEVMSYSDTEWSPGSVYESLGFSLLQEREPVWFYINRETFMRTSFNKMARQCSASAAENSASIKIHNLGSRKFIYHPLP